MPSHSGLFTTFTGCVLTTDDENRLSLHSNDHQPSPADKLRANGEFWLCRDDGLIGKFGNPDKVVFLYDNRVYNIWVELRGYSDDALEYGLIPIVPGGDYSNRFLAVNDQTGQLEIASEWKQQAKFRCVE
ncbi:uncharacterized protein BO88DRAFT_423828 [Aspergillus vadensis CBS 113365]|uniref:Uncharacterized protein n=1 Tax=Aspergillus vadensis (strain CBS 113365 / IMI 142717 / IBT 24658) TaxID=1448311 RepID=A0A319C6T3_ASPVC|nr:hypothetical protein BO88DRAFT_423828 [Aspergillus vadensis CBS 113365]PYH71028.1 hypothetical protein BO88DRAFT_423828 [Aspergillus vadensis CBS 113365]